MPLFPTCSFINLSGYEINYSRSEWGTRTKLLFQIPQLLGSIRRENQWLRQLLRTNPIDGIVSDNRYGLYHNSIPSILITHQLRICTGAGRLIDNALQKLHYRLITRFSQCWVPDTGIVPGAAGSLSHPDRLPTIPTQYIGCLSRLAKCLDQEENGILILLSGPEPQRSILEKMLLEQLSDVTGQVVLVRGSFTASPLTLPKNISIHDHCNSEQLNAIICNAEFVIARAGYTTIMDLLKLKKKSILIPTPGQTEQEYLGAHLMKNEWAVTLPQKDFSLKAALKKAASFPYKTLNLNTEEYKPVLREWVENIK